MLCRSALNFRMIGHSSKIIGLDISETQLDVARREVVDDSLTFEIGSCENIPVEDGSVDVVTAVQAAHYFNIPLFLKEVYKLYFFSIILGLIFERFV